MTKQEFIDSHKHELMGWLFDGLTRRREGGELSLFMSAYATKVESTLGQIFDQKIDPPEAKGLFGKEKK